VSLVSTARAAGILGLAAFAAGMASCRRSEPAPRISMIPSHPESAPPAENSGPRELPAGRVEVAGVSFSPPGVWRREQPSSPMRAAQFVIPGAGNEKDALFVVYFFGSGQGGSVAENVQRWKGQFTDASGAVAAGGVRTERRSGLNVTIVTAQGTFASGMPMGPMTPEPNSALWGAIVEGPQGNVFLKATGPKATIEYAGTAFAAVLDSLGSVGPSSTTM
jgi:hypothetical protein